MPDESSSVLSGLVVLDLTENRGLYAGKMLADLGADVIKIEKPVGSEARRIGPYKDDIPGPENSLYFINFNTNKRGITLNMEGPEGRDIFKQLVKRTDILVEDSEVGVMQSLGLDYPSLQELNPSLIMAAVTGFGQTGPYNTFKAPDIVSFAMGGLMNVNGPGDAAPVVAPCEQSHYSASIVSVFGIMAALLLRSTTGEGQLVDASAHEITATLTGGIMPYSNTSQIARRNGSQFGAVPGRIFPCKDGYVHILTIRPNHWVGFLEVVKMASPDISLIIGEEWYDAGFRNRNVDIIDALVTEFTMAHNKMEITEMCQAKDVPCTPVNTTADFAADPHIKERDFFIQIEHPVIGQHTYLRPPYRLSKTPCSINRPAPLLGQHNRDVYCDELGYSSDELSKLKAGGII
ncbi:MAG: CoA transferase [Dehalococcoidales bacterium]